MLSLLTTPWLIVAGAASVLGLLLYSGGPRPYASSGLGEISVFVFFGLVATCGTAFVQQDRLDAGVLWLAVPVGLLACALLMANNLRDIPTDTRGRQAHARGAPRRAAQPRAAHRDRRRSRSLLPSVGALVRVAAVA